MQLSAAELREVVVEDQQAREEALSIPLAGLLNGAVISSVLWAALIWTVYRIVG